MHVGVVYDRYGIRDQFAHVLSGTNYGANSTFDWIMTCYNMAEEFHLEGAFRKDRGEKIMTKKDRLEKYRVKLFVTQARGKEPAAVVADPIKFRKIRNKFAHRVQEPTCPYTPMNTAKWAMINIKAELLINLIDIADAMEYHPFSSIY